MNIFLMIIVVYYHEKACPNVFKSFLVYVFNYYIRQNNLKHNKHRSQLRTCKTVFLSQ